MLSHYKYDLLQVGVLLPVHGKRDAVVGEDAFAYRAGLDLCYPIGEKGKVVDFDAFEDLLSYSVECGLRCDMKGRPVLLCETYNQEKDTREREVQLLFETFQVDSAYVSVSSVLAMYATGQTTGIILECGSGRTLVIPVYEGYPVSHGVVEHCFAGRDMASLLAKRISEHEKNREMSVDLNNAYGVYLMESSLIPQVVDFTAKDSMPGSQPSAPDISSKFSLPDGREVYVDAAMIKECQDMYFSPSTDIAQSGDKPCQPASGLLQHAETCLRKMDIEVSRIRESFILTGGVSSCKGFYERFVTSFEPMATKYNIRARKPFSKCCASWRGHVKHPCHLAWYGGSILASLQTYGSMWIKKREYEESGPEIVHRKCF